MGRWQPDAQGRLQRAAIALFEEKGFEQTTVIEIADRAEVTERTFFRYFGDKREVLFQGSDELLTVAGEAIADAPGGLSPVALAVTGVRASAAVLEPRREYASVRAKVVAANPSLQERELLKMAAMSVAVATALRVRGVGEEQARLAADVAVTSFSAGFAAWISDDRPESFADRISEQFELLRSLTA